MHIKIYQIDEECDTRRLAFMHYDYAAKHGGVRLRDYKKVYEGDVDNAKDNEDLYYIFNHTQAIENMSGHSMSVSDIIERDGEFYFVDSIGFRRLVPAELLKITDDYDYGGDSDEQ